MSLSSLVWLKESNPLMNNTLCYDDLSYEPTYAKILSTSSSDILKFDNKRDAAFCVGIDELHHPVYANEEREKTVATDATEISKALVHILGFNPNQVKLSISSNPADTCTKEGLRISFMEYAKKVEPYGNFIFYFAGRGFECEGRCLLVPSNFDNEEKSGISGDDLVDWLNVSQCKASSVLLIFDCCYAGNLGERLSYHNGLKIQANLFAMCGCASKEKTKAMSTLDHSVFTFFLIDYWTTSKYKNEFKVQEAIHCISDLCFRFSSLILIFDKEGKMHYGTFNPRVYYRDAYIHERCISNVLPQLKEMTRTLYGWFEGDVRERPHQMVDDWLEFVITQVSQSVLARKAFSSEILKKAIMSASLHSAAFLHYVHEDGNGKGLLETRNLFIQIAIRVSNKIAFFDLRTAHVMTGLEHYISAINRLKFSCVKLDDLHEVMDNHIKNNAPNNCFFGHGKKCC